jgi:hypothetical protein
MGYQKFGFRIVSGVEILCLTTSQLETLLSQHSYLQEQFRGVEILRLTTSQLKTLLSQHSYLQEQYPGIRAIDDDPVPKLF